MRARNKDFSTHGSGHLLRCDDGYKPSSSDFYLARAVLCAARWALRDRREIESQTLIYSQPPLYGGSNYGLPVWTLGLYNYYSSFTGAQESTLLQIQLRGDLLININYK